MSLQPGDRLGPYEILAAVGAGGMGVVYRGRDTRLDRTVAVKVLPDAVAQDPERLARLEREAKMLAALNHPHIAQIYGVEGPALAMEFVEGEDLSALIARGPIPVDEALDIAQGIAEALEAAHELGIVHRDLKASNIRLRPDGTVKVLDFGLAKALAPASMLAEAVSAPTITTPAITHQNVVLGTAAYMSPEQARGKPVDKRADIWAFGVVLYEMVTGRRPFDGETVSDSLASALKSEPDWTPVPPQLRRLLRSCLEKDPRKRLRDIGDWRRQLEDQGVLAPAPAATRAWLPWSLSATLALVAGALAFVHFRESAPQAEPVSFQIPPPARSTFETALAVSPDGGRIAFTARDAEGVVRIWVRDVGALEPRPIAGTEDARNVAWSPDGRSIAFNAGRSLKRTGVDQGPPLTIYEADSQDALGVASWSPHGVLVVGGVRAGGIRLVRETGGAVSILTSPDPAKGDLVHGLPAFLPDGRHFLYVRVGTDPAASGLFLGSIDRKPEEQIPTRLLATSHAVFTNMAPAGGALVYLRQSTLVAHPFDAEGLTFAGEPVPIAEGVGNFGALGFFSAAGGIVAYRSGTRVGGGRESQLTWIDRNGRTTGVVGGPMAYDGVWLSPDGGRAAVIQAGLSDSGLGNIDIWLVDLVRSVSQRLTSAPAPDRNPVWSPQGDRIAFNSGRAGQQDLYVTTPSGAEELLFKSDVQKSVSHWSRDGRFLLFNANNPETRSDVFLLPLDGDRQPVPLVQSTFAESDARFSADTRWIAYTSDVSGRQEIYVRPFDPAAPASAPGGPTIVSRDGGRLPKWRRDGRELIFESLSGTLMSVDITLDADQIRPGAPKPLFTLPPAVFWDVTDDGQRFLVTMPTVEGGLTPITVMMNWTPR